jgi:LIVCS family branched-chain amino acid:cation transporter
MSKAITKRSAVISSGLAMFAMFFGAGNIVFPLVLGQVSQGNNLWGVLGMMFTAVIIPLIGLMAMLTYEGDYRNFFSRIGKWPGLMLSAIIVAVIGPFAGLPRCITISYSTIAAFGFENSKWLTLISFSLFSCLMIFLFTYKQRKILTLIGYVLTPILLTSLAIIAVKGLLMMPLAETTTATRIHTFMHGFVSGYHTMDLLAAFFFSSVVLLCLKQNEHTGQEKGEFPSRLKIAIYGSLIAASLLTLVYMSFSFVAAGFSTHLQNIPSSQLLSYLAQLLLGPQAGLVTSVAVVFTCFTTEIALAIVFANYLHKIILKERFSYTACMVITLAIAFLISTLQFEGISHFLGPILQICYPALIVLTVLNLCNKLYGFKPVKRVFYLAMGISLLANVIF